MSDAMNVHEFPAGGDNADGPVHFSPPRGTLVAKHEAIGEIVEIAGSGARVEINGRRLAELAVDPDPSVALSGQVGSQIKIDSGRRWLLANVRNLKVTDPEAGAVTQASACGRNWISPVTTSYTAPMMATRPASWRRLSVSLWRNTMSVTRATLA